MITKWFINTKQAWNYIKIEINLFLQIAIMKNNRASFILTTILIIPKYCTAYNFSFHFHMHFQWLVQITCKITWSGLIFRNGVQTLPSAQISSTHTSTEIWAHTSFTEMTVQLNGGDTAHSLINAGKAQPFMQYQCQLCTTNKFTNKILYMKCNLH